MERIEKNLFWLWCGDFSDAGLYDIRNCCNSCHSEQEDGYYNMVQIYPPKKDSNNEDTYSRFLSDACCGLLEKKFSRNDWAKTIKVKRKANK